MIRINAVFSDDILKKIDAISKEAKKSRSRILREATEKYITEYEQQKEEEERKRRFEEAIQTQDKLRKKACKWDGVSEIRKWRERAR